MQKCTSFLRFSASLPDNWLMPAMSIQKLVVRAVNAESALEKAAAMMPMVKNISTANPRWPSAANKAVSHPRLPAGGCSVARRTITAGFRVTGTGN